MAENGNLKIGFLGPTGTWAEEALIAATAVSADETQPIPSVYDVIAAVAAGEVSQGIVPMENAIEGSVSATLDVLAFEVENVHIVREIVHPIRHRLIAGNRLPLDQIEKLLSHPHAHAQCRRFIREKLPQAEIVAANSTAEAVRLVSLSDRKWAAIGSSLAAKSYGCMIIEDDIEDYAGNQTRFVMLSTTPAPQDLETGYKTSIVCTIAHDQPGSLLQILQEFAHRYVNLTKIESRPSKKGLGDYVFFIDVEGRKDDEQVAAAIKCLECKLARVKMLGSYPVG
ncbi:MAG: prephenate dehydratase [Thermoleophilia bacterium]|nr:prephenate dehydratase [Thermoleophilia bacterium]